MSESTVIQPGPGQSILTTDHHGHDNHNQHHGHDSVEARADFRSLTAEVERFGTLNGDRIKDGFSVSGDRVNAVGAAAQLAACRTDSLVQSGVKDVTGAIGTVGTAQALASCEIDKIIANAYASLQKQGSDSATQTVVGFKELQGQGYLIEGRALLEAAKNANAAAVLATANANAASVQATMFANAAALQAEKIASAAALAAQQIASEAARQLAECCCKMELEAAKNFAALQAQAAANVCELKSLILSSTAEVKQQAADFRMRDLEQRLASIPRGIAVTIPVGVG